MYSNFAKMRFPTAAVARMRLREFQGFLLNRRRSWHKSGKTICVFAVQPSEFTINYFSVSLVYLTPSIKMRDL